MSVPFSTFIAALTGPDIWWAYEGMIIFAFWLISFFKKWGKDLHVIGDFDPGGMFHELAHFYVDPLKQAFRTKSGKGFATERHRFGYVQSAIGGDRRVIFHALRRARPRTTEMTREDGGKEPSEYETLKFDVDKTLPQVIIGKAKNGQPKVEDAEDPSSEDFGRFLAGETKNQVAAGSTGSATYGKALLIMVLVFGAVLGAFAVAIYLTHGFTVNPLEAGKTAAQQITCAPPASVSFVNGTAVCS